MSEWIFPDHEWDDGPVGDDLERYTALARARKEKPMSTHEYRVRKRRMCQAIHLPTSTTMAALKEAWLAEGLRWPNDDEITDPDHIDLNEFRITKKETTMPTKNTATTATTKNAQPTLIDIAPIAQPKTKKATTKKETTMAKNEKPRKKSNLVKFAADDLRGVEWSKATIAMQDAAVAAVRDVYGDADDFKPVNFVKELKAAKTGKTPGKINRSDEQIANLAAIANDLGWTDPRFCNESEVKDIKGGKIKDGAFGFMMYFNIGASIKHYYVYNIKDIEFEGDEPTLADPVEKPAKPAKPANGKAKHDPTVAALEKKLAALEAANAAEKERNDQMQAMFMALMQKLA